MPRPGRLGVALLVSALLHVVALAFVVREGLAPVHPALVAIPVALVGKTGGGGGGRGELLERGDGRGDRPGSPMPEPAPPTEPAARRPSTSLHPRAALTRRPAAPRELAPAVPDTSAIADAGAPGEEASGRGSAADRAGGDGTGGDGGGGDGSGGDGSGGARVAYGTNPLPPYPLVARRLGKEGVVLLEVVVAADGRAADVRVLRSSGFPPLDESAATTVRERWRFVPARRGGAPVESRVTVPIRFRLEDARG